MILPDKHMKLKTSVVNISAFILTNLKLGQEIEYTKLLEKTVSLLGDDIKENFPHALSFLFLLGKLKYIQESDSLTVI